MKLPENVSESVKRLNKHLYGRQDNDSCAGLCANDSQPTKGNSLERAVPRKDSSGPVAFERYRIRFTVYSVQPCDWDGYSVKELQDMLVRATILFGDDWRILQGEVVSEKAHSKAEEKTVIEIEAL